MNTPKVSIVMSVHNGEKYLREAVESMLVQSFHDFEYIIIDDGSTDNSSAIIESFNDNRIIFLKNSTKSGLAKSLNKGIDVARGTYIVRMDADDISLPQRLAVQVEFMDNNPSIGISGTWAKTFGKKSFTWKNPTKDVEIKTLMLFTSCLLHPTIIMRRDVLEKNHLRYDETYTSAQDYELWSRAADVTLFANIPKVLLNYRIHQTSTTSTQSTTQNTNAEKVRIYLHRKLGINSSNAIPFGSSSFSEKKTRLLELKSVNTTKKVFSEKEFTTMIGKVWLSTCMDNASLGLIVWDEYRASPLRVSTAQNSLKSYLLLAKTLVATIRNKTA